MNIIDLILFTIYEKKAALMYRPLVPRYVASFYLTISGTRVDTTFTRIILPLRKFLLDPSYRPGTKLFKRLRNMGVDSISISLCRAYIAEEGEILYT